MNDESVKVQIKKITVMLEKFRDGETEPYEVIKREVLIDELN
jgi:hypothetical protein